MRSRTVFNRENSKDLEKKAPKSNSFFPAIDLSKRKAIFFKTTAEFQLDNINRLMKGFKEEIKTSENRQALEANPSYASNIAWGLEFLHANGALTPQKRVILCAYAEFVFEIAPKLAKTKQNPLQTDTGSEIEIKQSLSKLKKYKLDSVANKEALEVNPSFVSDITWGLMILKEYGALTPQNRLRLCTHPEFTFEMVPALIILQRAGLDDFSNWSYLCLNLERANFIAPSFGVLSKKPVLFTSLNKGRLASVYKGLKYTEAQNFFNALLFIYWKGALTDKILIRLCNNPLDAPNIWQEVRCNKGENTLKRSRLQFSSAPIPLGPLRESAETEGNVNLSSPQ